MMVHYICISRRSCVCFGWRRRRNRWIGAVGTFVPGAVLHLNVAFASEAQLGSTSAERHVLFVFIRIQAQFTIGALCLPLTISLSLWIQNCLRVKNFKFSNGKTVTLWVSRFIFSTISPHSHLILAWNSSKWSCFTFLYITKKAQLELFCYYRLLYRLFIEFPPFPRWL